MTLEAKSSAQALEMLVGLSAELLLVLKWVTLLWGLLSCTSQEDQTIKCSPSRPSAQGWVYVADDQFPRDLVPDLAEEAPKLIIFSWFWSCVLEQSLACSL